MTATPLATARPKNCAIAWVYKGDLYVEYPCKNGGPPYIVRHRCTPGELARAFNLLIENPDEAPNLTPQVDHPAIKRVKERAPWANDEQRAAARTVLRKLGIVAK